jgi:citrate lyase beta subunit
MPGNEIKKIEKATTLGVDCACLDLEDGVAPNMKEQARLVVTEALQTLSFGSTERLVRINGIGSGLEEGDLEVALPLHPDGVVIPKVESAAEIHWASDRIARFERTREWQLGSIRLLVMIETARGIVNLRDIAAADSRLDALIFGGLDFAADIGARITREGKELFFARSAVVTFAAAFGLQAIDLLYTDFRDEPGLREEARRGMEMGYAGMQIIHPNQVGPVQEIFTPDEEAIRNAQHVLESYEQNKREGRGAFVVDDKMVDMPVVKAAKRLLARAGKTRPSGQK